MQDSSLRFVAIGRDLWDLSSRSLSRGNLHKSGQGSINLSSGVSSGIKAGRKFAQLSSDEQQRYCALRMGYIEVETKRSILRP